MPIIVRLDVMLALRKVRSKELAADIGMTEANLSLLKSGKVRGFRFSTLDAICKFLDCQPGDILEYQPDEKPTALQVHRQVVDAAFDIRKRNCFAEFQRRRVRPAKVCCNEDHRE